MKILIFIFIISLNSLFKANATDLETIRKNYELAVDDKEICEKMINELSNNSTKNSLYLAYLGAFQTIWANHVFNPISKLKTFKRGKTNIEKAINEDPNNIEIRFIRLSVQKNCPRFLGYDDNIQEDQAFLNNNKKSILSPNLSKMVKLLLNS